jgi:peroxiredoxin
MNLPSSSVRWCAALVLCLMFDAAVAADARPGQQTLPPLPKPFTAPDFSLKDENGKVHRLADYRGKVVVLNFWATWCPPCREEMPAMERAHQKVKGEKIAIIAVNVGEDEDTVFGFTGQYPLTFPLPLDTDGSVIRKYPVIGLPTTFIIDPRGQATHQTVGGRHWDDDKLLDQLRGMLKP